MRASTTDDKVYGDLDVRVDSIIYAAILILAAIESGIMQLIGWDYAR